ncbi:hypothetical protein CHLRE_01g016450v5 [Chlamydomonas reinhardtii]|uniref:SET domain-containing protein n=1 Tax=Chlamydomonas reinhardtii TaxID=3055 RepID=A0A2K3E5V3_CHLRE|nr:uncharacterized protein CHLRE_01g016450v5 [Chlamydomonas reinhardtii]PNW88146.1 hypothetical protein CHLRE_01g016450v5 [Chlamydomonas reinhardtii]
MAEFTEAEKRDGFAVRYSPGKGRHLVAARAFAAGEVVLQQEPYAAVLSDEMTPGVCDHCFRHCARPLRCGRSRLARYCCRAHQAAAWGPGGYRAECEALVRCAPRVPPPTVRLAARVLWRRARDLEHKKQQQQQQQFGTAPVATASQPTAPAPAPAAPAPAPPTAHAHHDPPHDSDHEGLWALCSHWESLDARRRGMYAQLAVVTWQYMFGTPDGPLPPADGDEAVAAASSSSTGAAAGAATAAWPGFKEVAQLLARLAVNCHTVCDEELRPLGTALYPSGALANHSCRPSTVQVFRGRTLQLRALRPLAPGQEVTLCYLEPAATAQERREALWDSYCFDVAAPATSGGAGAGAGAGAGGADGAGATAAGATATAAGAETAEDAAGAGATAMEVEGEGAAAAAPGRPAGMAATPFCAAAAAECLRPPPALTLDLMPGARLLVYGPNTSTTTTNTTTSIDTNSTTTTNTITSSTNSITTTTTNSTSSNGAGEGTGPAAHWSGRPPWPEDEGVDTELTRVVWAPAAAAEAEAEAAVPVAVAGGLLARLVPKRPNEPEEEEEEEEEEGEEEGEGGEGGAGRGQQQGLGSVGEEEEEGAGAGAGLGPGAAAGRGHASAPGRRPPPLQMPAKPGGGAGGGGGSGGGGGGRREQPPRIEVLAWGPWVSQLLAAAAAAGAGNAATATATAAATAAASAAGAATAAAGSGPVPSHAAVAGLLRRCVAALQMSACAAEFAGEKRFGNAVELLVGALDTLAQPDSPENHSRQPPKPAITATEAASGPGAAATDSAVGPGGGGGGLVLGPHHLLTARLRAQLLKAAIDCASSGGGGGGGRSAGDCMDVDGSGGGGGGAAGEEDEGAGVQRMWQLALGTARDLVPHYQLVYGAVMAAPGCSGYSGSSSGSGSSSSSTAWPGLSLHFATVAKLESLLGRPRRALAAAAAAMAGLRLTHPVGAASGGGGSGGDGGEAAAVGESVTAQVLRVAREAEAEMAMRQQQQRQRRVMAGAAGGQQDEQEEED